MSWERNNPSIVSMPIQLSWMGWETDTYRLQQNGWMISAQQDVATNRMQISFKHKDVGMYGLTDVDEFDFMNARRNPEMLRHLNYACKMGANLRISQRLHMNMANECMIPIDANPQYTTIEERSLEDFAHFQKVNTDAKAIFLQEASMDDILQLALEKQAPNQEKIRKQLVRRKEMESIKQKSQLHTELRLVA